MTRAPAIAVDAPPRRPIRTPGLDPFEPADVEAGVRCRVTGAGAGMGTGTRTRTEHLRRDGTMPALLGLGDPFVPPPLGGPIMQTLPPGHALDACDVAVGDRRCLVLAAAWRA